MTSSIPGIGAVLPRMLLSTVLLAAAAAQAAPTYTVTVVGGADSEALALNESGQVAGYLTAGDTNHAFFYDGNVLSDLGTLGYTSSVAYGLNDSGTVVGSAYTGVGQRQAFVTAGGVASALPFVGYSGANDINNAGVIVGDTFFPDGQGGTVVHGYKYENGVAIDLGAGPYGYSSEGLGVNEAGYVSGSVVVDGAPNFPSHPFLYTTGPLQDLGDFGGVFGYGYAINNNNQVVGTAGRFSSPELPGDIYPRRAFLYENGAMQDLGSLLDNGSSIAYDINDAGQIVGVSATLDENTAGAFYYEDGQMVLLDTLLEPGSGWSVANAYAINEPGQIAGTACKDGACYAVRLDLAPPVPEPAQLGMVGAGAVLLLGRGGSRRVRQWCDRFAGRTLAPGGA